MNEALMRAVAELAVFFALADDRSLNPDVAVRELETLAATLRLLNTTEREEFARFVTEELATEADDARDGLRATALRELPANLGIV